MDKLNFRQFLENNPLHIPFPKGGNTVGTHNDGASGHNNYNGGGAYLPSTSTGGSEDLGAYGYGLPSTNMTLPVMKRESEVKSVENAPGWFYVWLNEKGLSKKATRTNGQNNKTDIVVKLEDGTRVEMSYPRFKNFSSLLMKKMLHREKVQVYFRRGESEEGSALSNIIQMK